jgi:cytochrome c oxidase cbb3-type subunit 4
MTYETVARFAQQGGTLWFMILFLAGCAYAFWPAKKDEFDKAARMPLEGDD